MKNVLLFIELNSIVAEMGFGLLLAFWSRTLGDPTEHKTSKLQNPTNFFSYSLSFNVPLSSRPSPSLTFSATLFLSSPNSLPTATHAPGMFLSLWLEETQSCSFMAGAPRIWVCFRDTRQGASSRSWFLTAPWCLSVDVNEELGNLHDESWQQHAKSKGMGGAAMVEANLNYVLQASERCGFSDP